MSDYLVDHAVMNAWCSPRQDLQVILKPARISSARGVYVSSPHLWGTVPLPTIGDQYHLYQIGQIHPTLLGLFPERQVWHRLSSVMGLENLMADVYTNSGLHLPRFETWILVTGERDVLMAVKSQPRIADLKTTPIYLRLYSNAYFGSDRADSEDDKIVCKGIKVTDANQALSFQRDYLDHVEYTGLTTLYVNGVFVHNYLPGQLAAGDIAEFVYDSTVKQVIDFPIGSLETFESTLDLKHKYLLHYGGPQTGGEGIDYRDDIDVYLIEKGSSGGNPAWNGVYFHKNQNDAFRQVTHRDYSVAVPYVLAYLNTRPQWLDSQALTLRLHIRKSGWQRPLIHEHHRIRELYKLEEEDLLQAMVGSDSVVPVWRAPALEASAYTQLMDSYFEQITNQLVEDAYGYNAIAKLIADTPQQVQVVSGLRQVTLPFGLQTNSTIYEFDTNGVLLGFYNHTSGEKYFPVNATTTLIEGTVGEGSLELDTTFYSLHNILDPKASYRFYNAPIVGGIVQQSEWTDVTGNTAKYGIIGNTATWFVDRNTVAVAVKSDKKILAYDLILSPQNGLLKFSIDAEATYPSGSALGVMFIPMGKLDLWLNGYALIENLDYFVKWPQIVITNKAYLVPGNNQKLTVRATGFCRSDMTREPTKDVGFVKYGLLSRNARFDIRDDKVVRVIANGATYHRNALIYSEEDDGIIGAPVPNGVPYLIEDVVVPLRGIVDTDTYELRAVSKAVDQSVEDYLTLKLPELVKTLPDMIPDKYPIYSPFASTIMYDLINGVLPMTNFQGQYSDKKVLDFLPAYLYLLDYDPTKKNLDLAHVSIHPHNLNVETQLDIYQYNFLARVIRIYLGDKVDITRFISINTGP